MDTSPGSTNKREKRHEPISSRSRCAGTSVEQYFAVTRRVRSLRKYGMSGKVRLSFFGAAGTVTGSRYLVEADDRRILVDCGLFQGGKELRARNWTRLPFDPRSIDAVVLTHAHIDHSGFLPGLVRAGFSGPIYCSEGTFELCKILLPDSAHLQEVDAKFAHKRGFSRHKPALPLYTREDADRCLGQFAPMATEVTFEAAKGFAV